MKRVGTLKELGVKPFDIVYSEEYGPKMRFRVFPEDLEHLDSKFTRADYIILERQNPYGAHFTLHEEYEPVRYIEIDEFIFKLENLMQILTDLYDDEDIVITNKAMSTVFKRYNVIENEGSVGLCVSEKGPDFDKFYARIQELSNA